MSRHHDVPCYSPFRRGAHGDLGAGSYTDVGRRSEPIM